MLLDDILMGLFLVAVPKTESVAMEKNSVVKVVRVTVTPPRCVASFQKGAISNAVSILAAVLVCVAKLSVHRYLLTSYRRLVRYH